MAGSENTRARLVCSLAALVVLGACGDNLDGSSGAAPVVALDRNIVTGPAGDIDKCSRFPSRC